MFFWFRWWNNCENRLIFDEVKAYEVKAYKKVRQFFGPPCIIRKTTPAPSVCYINVSVNIEWGYSLMLRSEVQMRVIRMLCYRATYTNIREQRMKSEYAIDENVTRRHWYRTLSSDVYKQTLQPDWGWRRGCVNFQNTGSHLILHLHKKIEAVLLLECN